MRRQERPFLFRSVKVSPRDERLWLNVLKFRTVVVRHTILDKHYKRFKNSYTRRLYWFIPGVPIKAAFIEQNRT